MRQFLNDLVDFVFRVSVCLAVLIALALLMTQFKREAFQQIRTNVLPWPIHVEPELYSPFMARSS